MRFRAWPIPILLLSTLAVVPIVGAAPVVLPTSDSAYAIDAAFPTNDLISTRPFVPQQRHFTVTGPDGQTIENTHESLTMQTRCGVTATWGTTILNSLAGVPTLHGHPGDGTFTITAIAAQGAMQVCITVGGKDAIMCFPVQGTQVWNWRSSGATFVDDNVDLGSAGCTTTTEVLTAEDDPNNAVFFQDTPASDPSAFSQPATVTCPNATTLNGVWARGSLQTLNTFATFYHVQGTVPGDNDLRDNLGVASTGYVDKGSGVQGTHSATIPYNNAAGNSYQLAAKNGTAGAEQLGAVLFVAPMQCTITSPSFIGFLFDPDELQVIASQAQCNGDQTSFVVNVGVTQTLNDLDVIIRNTMTNDIILTIDDSEMFQQPGGSGNQVLYFNRTLPPGTFVAIARGDFAGLGALDFFTGGPFNVPLGTCTDTPYDDSELRAFIVARTNQTNGYVNSTSAAIIATVDFNQLQTEVQVNQVHSHIDSHFNQTWAMITDFEGNITAILNDLCSGGGCNFTVDNEPVIQALEAQQMRFLDLDTQTSWTFLLFLALLIWCWYQRWLFVAIASVIGILDAFMVPHVLGFKGTALVLVAGVVLQILVDMRDAWREKKEQEEASGGETT